MNLKLKLNLKPNTKGMLNESRSEEISLEIIAKEKVDKINALIDLLIC